VNPYKLSLALEVPGSQFPLYRSRVVGILGVLMYIAYALCSAGEQGTSSFLQSLHARDKGGSTPSTPPPPPPKLGRTAGQDGS